VATYVGSILERGARAKLSLVRTISWVQNKMSAAGAKNAQKQKQLNQRRLRDGPKGRGKEVGVFTTATSLISAEHSNLAGPY
jgi:hypothetical protein